MLDRDAPGSGDEDAIAEEPTEPVAEEDPAASVGLTCSAGESLTATKMQAMQRGKATRQQTQDQKDEKERESHVDLRMMMSPLPLGVAPAAANDGAVMGLGGPAGEDKQGVSTLSRLAHLLLLTVARLNRVSLPVLLRPHSRNWNSRVQTWYATRLT